MNTLNDTARASLVIEFDKQDSDLISLTPWVHGVGQNRITLSRRDAVKLANALLDMAGAGTGDDILEIKVNN